MAESGATSYTERLQNCKKTNKKKIKRLKQQLKKTRNTGAATGKDEVLEEKIQGLQKENQMIKEEITELNESNTELQWTISDNINGPSEDVGVLYLLCTKLQENMYKIVLEEYYNEMGGHSANDIEGHILTQIEDIEDQTAANRRWEALKKEIDWDPSLTNIMASLPQERNYPPLTEARIKRAKFNLEKMNYLSNEKVNAVDKLTDMWKQTNTKLQLARPQKSLKKPRKALEPGSSAETSKVKHIDNTAIQVKHTKETMIDSEIPKNTQTPGIKATKLLKGTTSTGESISNAEKTLKQKEEELQRIKEELEELKTQNQNLQNEDAKKMEEIEALKKRIERLEKEVESLKLKLQESEENQHKLNLGSMCDKMQKIFYQIVFYPYDFSKYIESYKVVEIDGDIERGSYGLSSEDPKEEEGKKSAAKDRWETLKKELGWNFKYHLNDIKSLKKARMSPAHPAITKDMKEKLKEDAKALRDNMELNPTRYRYTVNLIEMWYKSEEYYLKLKTMNKS